MKIINKLQVNGLIIGDLIFSTNFKNKFKKYKEKSLIECEKHFGKLEDSKSSGFQYNSYCISKNEKELKHYTFEELDDLTHNMRNTKHLK